MVDQNYFEWDESQELQRGDPVQGLSFDVAFLKKLSHKGPVQAVGKDRGTSFAVSVEQLFVDTDIQPGASGSGFFNIQRELVMAPLSYRWAYSTSSEEGVSAYARITASGTTSRVSQPLTNMMLNPNTPPNGALNYYHIPSLGIIPTSVVGAVDLWNDWGGMGYFPFTQNKGIIFQFFASQGFYEYLATNYACSFAPYTVTPPSMLGAPLDVTLSGTPPNPMIDFPGGTGVFPLINLVVLVAIERNLDHNDWAYLGEDAGLETVTGIIIGSRKWVGDVVRVKVRSIQSMDPTNPASNWEGIYRVTLNAVDPFFDALYIDALASYVSFLRVDRTNGTAVYLDPAVAMPNHMRGYRPHPGRTPKPVRNTLAANLISPVPDGVDIYSLPTMAEDYATFMQKRRGEVWVINACNQSINHRHIVPRRLRPSVNCPKRAKASAQVPCKGPS